MPEAMRGIMTWTIIIIPSFIHSFIRHTRQTPQPKA